MGAAKSGIFEKIALKAAFAACCDSKLRGENNE
jgi:hypothetical protein